MKIKCQKENLVTGIMTVQKAVPARTSIPVLEGILIEADNEFKLTANDLEIGIECYVEAEILKKGSTVINARIFGEIARKLPDSEITIEMNGEGIILIDCENSHFEIKGMQTAGFPELPDIKKDKAFTLSQGLMKDMIRKTIFAVSADENRPVLTGTFMESKNGELAFVSCDSFRVAYMKSAINADAPEFSVIVPGKTLGELAKILAQGDDKIDVYSTGSQILFDMGTCKMVSRLIAGEYFKYRSFIPAEFETEIRLNTKDFLAGIERASLVITAEERRYPVKFNVGDGRIIINTSSDIGTVREELKGRTEGKELEVYFNPRYFLEALRVVNDDDIKVGFSTGICAIKSIDKDDFIYLIVPLRK